MVLEFFVFPKPIIEARHCRQVWSCTPTLHKNGASDRKSMDIICKFLSYRQNSFLWWGFGGGFVLRLRTALSCSDPCRLSSRVENWWLSIVIAICELIALNSVTKLDVDSVLFEFLCLYQWQKLPKRGGFFLFQNFKMVAETRISHASKLALLF